MLRSVWQLLLNTEELRKRMGKKYCDEAELVLPLRAHNDAHALQVARRRRRIAAIASLVDL